MAQKTKRTLLKAVRHEIEMLKQYATQSEISNLNIEHLDPNEPEQCIYGQLTGNCENYRAKQLMDLACIRVFAFEASCTNNLDKKTVEDGVVDLNGEYKGQEVK